METTTTETVVTESEPPKEGDQTLVVIAPTTESTSSSELTVIELMDRIQEVQTNLTSSLSTINQEISGLYTRLAELENPKAPEETETAIPVVAEIEPPKDQKAPKTNKSGLVKLLLGA